MTSPFFVPDAALPFVLFQRTDYLQLPKIRLYRKLSEVLQSRFGISLRNQAVSFEARMRRSRIKRLYAEDMAREYNTIKKHLPDVVNSSLDIGCGTAGLDAFVWQHYAQQGEPLHLHLLDKTFLAESVSYGYQERGAFYSSLELAAELLVGNGVPDDSIQLIEATDDNAIAGSDPF